jgi:murein DD-endopeptidase MepM/ murein hydrolase activator NlpD
MYCPKREMPMSHKFLSFIIIPHGKAKSKTIALSKKTVKIAAGIGIFVFVALTVFLVDYFTMSVTRQKYAQLNKKSINQEKSISRYKKTVQELQSSIKRFEDYAKKINVMAGLKSQEALEGEPGVGGPSGAPDLNSPNPSQSLNISDLQNISQKAEHIEKNLTTLSNFWENKRLQLAATPTIWPTKGYMSSAYGWRDDPFTGKRAFHHGIDIATNHGNPVFATADGVVIQARSDKIGGRTIKIKHLFGYITVYCHLSKFLVKVGQKVKRGGTIGLVGRTGKALGPHVHYEIRLNGKEKNPYYYLLEE